MKERKNVKFEIKYLNKVKFIETLNKLDSKLSLKILKELTMIEYGLKEYLETKPLQDELFEIKTTVGTNSFRTLFFYDTKEKRCIVVVGGFVKASKKTPRRILRMRY